MTTPFLRPSHDELLAARREKRASLLVDPANTRAYRAYTRWGWHKAARLQPANGPQLDALILDLPQRRRTPHPRP